MLSDEMRKGDWKEGRMDTYSNVHGHPEFRLAYTHGRRFKRCERLGLVD
jgi:hypothetical protein